MVWRVLNNLRVQGSMVQGSEVKNPFYWFDWFNLFNWLHPCDRSFYSLLYALCIKRDGVDLLRFLYP